MVWLKKPRHVILLSCVCPINTDQIIRLNRISLFFVSFLFFSFPHFFCRLSHPTNHEHSPPPLLDSAFARLGKPFKNTSDLKSGDFCCGFDFLCWPLFDTNFSGFSFLPSISLFRGWCEVIIVEETSPWMWVEPFFSSVNFVLLSFFRENCCASATICWVWVCFVCLRLFAYLCFGWWSRDWVIGIWFRSVS